MGARAEGGDLGPNGPDFFNLSVGLYGNMVAGSYTLPTSFGSNFIVDTEPFLEIGHESVALWLASGDMVVKTSNEATLDVAFNMAFNTETPGDHLTLTGGTVTANCHLETTCAN